MFAYLKNPSASIRKRLAAIEYSANKTEALDQEVAEMKRVRACFEKIQNLDAETVLFHGADSLESFVRILSEHGVEAEEPHLRTCIAMLRDTDNDDPLFLRGISKAGKVLEDNGHSGSLTIKASILASVGGWDDPLVEERMNHSVKVFEGVLDYECLDDFAVPKKGAYVYRKNKLFPDFFNLRILAFTEAWKTETNLKAVARSMDRLIELQPIPNVYMEHKGQLIAPGSYLMHEFDTDFCQCNDDKKAEWLLRSEALARMGVLKYLKNAPKTLANLDCAADVLRSANAIKKSYAFMKWGGYGGVSLEEDWKKAERKINDVAFRVGLIKHYLNQNRPIQ